jgi:hypothetical protein
VKRSSFDKLRMEVPLTRGDRLTRSNYYQPWLNTPSVSAFEVPWKQRTEALLDKLRSNRFGWGLTFLIVNFSSSGSGKFVEDLVGDGLIVSTDRLAFAVTDAALDPSVGSVLYDEDFDWRVKPRILNWRSETDRGRLQNEAFDVVFVGAENEMDAQVSAATTVDASLIVINGDGAEFNRLAIEESDPERPTFSYRAANDHLQPLYVPGRSIEFAEHIQEAMAACEFGRGELCSEANCPGQLVGELLLKSFLAQR